MSQAGKACRGEVMVFDAMPWETLEGWHMEAVEYRSDTIRHLYKM